MGLGMLPPYRVKGGMQLLENDRKRWGRNHTRGAHSLELYSYVTWPQTFSDLTFILLRSWFLMFSTKKNFHEQANSLQEHKLVSP